MTQGIYELKINDVKYIGKDSNIHESKRYKHHLSLLKNNKHHNKYLQRAYNKYGDLKYNVLIEFNGIDQETLNKAEMFYIDLFETMNEGFNQTIGGEGIKGREKTLEEIDKMRQTKIKGFKEGLYKKTNGETNGMNKLTEANVKEIVQYFYKQEKSEIEIGEIYNVERRTISTIYNGVRWSYLKEVQDWLKFKDENKHKLRKQGINTLLPIDVYEIKHLLKIGFGNTELAKLYNSSVMTIYRINKSLAYQEVDISKPHSYYKL